MTRTTRITCTALEKTKNFTFAPNIFENDLTHTRILCYNYEAEFKRLGENNMRVWRNWQTRKIQVLVGATS